MVFITFSHLNRLYLLVAAVPRNQSAVFTARHQRAVPQHAQSKDAALVSSLDDVADAISACVTVMGLDGRKSSAKESKGRLLAEGRLSDNQTDSDQYSR